MKQRGIVTQVVINCRDEVVQSFASHERSQLKAKLILSSTTSRDRFRADAANAFEFMFAFSLVPLLRLANQLISDAKRKELKVDVIVFDAGVWSLFNMKNAKKRKAMQRRFYFDLSVLAREANAAVLCPPLTL